MKMRLVLALVVAIGGAFGHCPRQSRPETRPAAVRRKESQPRPCARFPPCSTARCGRPLSTCTRTGPRRSTTPYIGNWRPRSKGRWMQRPPVTLFQRLAAYGRIGHARVDDRHHCLRRPFARRRTMLPLFISVDGRRALLTEAAEVLGVAGRGEITAIDGVPIHEVINRLGVYGFGGAALHGCCADGSRAFRRQHGLAGSRLARFSGGDGTHCRPVGIDPCPEP